MSTEERNCGNCQHFDGPLGESPFGLDSFSGSGYCRRNPPQVVTKVGVWPLVEAGSWCGEFANNSMGNAQDDDTDIDARELMRDHPPCYVLQWWQKGVWAIVNTESSKPIPADYRSDRQYKYAYWDGEKFGEWLPFEATG